jgi:hypothetical protein
MLMSTEEVWEGLYGEPGLPSALHEAQHLDSRYGPGSYVEFVKYYENEPDYPTDECPEHGEQEVR